MNLGTNEPKKLVALGALVLVAGYLVYANLLSGPSVPAAAPSGARPAVEVPAVPIASAPPEAPRAAAPRALATRGRGDEFHPVLRSKRPEDRIDPTKVDPTLRLDLLAKLQMASAQAGRNLFQFGQPPAKVEPLKGPEPKVALNKLPETPAGPPKPPPPPPPPPITLKYYGYSSVPGASAKTAFFLDGEDILVAREGETLKRRYRLLRIGVNSVVMEDTESKRQQTIPLAEEAG